MKDRSRFLTEELKINFFSNSINEIEKKYESVTRDNNKLRSKIRDLNNKKKEIINDWEIVHNNIFTLINDIASELYEKNLKGEQDFKNYTIFVEWYKKHFQEKKGSSEEIFQSKIDERDNAISYFEKKIFNKNTYKGLLSKSQKKYDEIDKVDSEARKLSKKIKKQVYIANIDSSEIVRFLNEKQEWLKTKAQVFNQQKPGHLKLRGFMLECQKIFGAVEKIISDPYISRTISFGAPAENKPAEKKSDERFSMSVHSIFDTGLNVILLGGAGAGKTTSIQMYTKYLLEKTSKMAFYLPLARVLSTLGKKINPNKPPVDYLQKAILRFLSSIGNKIDGSEFEKILSNNQTIFVFDGIDEVIGSYAWITNAIKDLGKRFPGAQQIISSRFGGKYFRELPYLSVQLLPFTNHQRNKFFEAWFEGNEEVNSSDILEHIDSHNEIGEIVRTPLLATILCVLAEFKIPLPESEVRLYEERMNLLLGHYDTHKGIKRIKTNSKILETVARKLAYDFHKNGVSPSLTP